MPESRHLGYMGAAAAVGASTLVPLPLVDDWIASWSRRALVAAALKRHGRQAPVGELDALYNDGSSLLGLPWRIAKGVLLWPVNKVLKKLLVVFAARDIALAVGRTIALGHTVERQLTLGMFRDDDTPARRRDDARRLRQALDFAWAGIDVRLVQRAAGAVMQRKAAAAELDAFLEELDRRVDQRLAGIA